MNKVRHLLLVFGDQLDAQSAVFADMDPAQDLVLMIEARSESTIVWSHKARIALFLSAMRHHAEALRQQGWHVDYRHLDAHDWPDLPTAVEALLTVYRPRSLRYLRPGTWALKASVEALCERCGVRAQEIQEDRRFLFSLADFDAWAGRRRQYRMEHWYRHARQRSGILMEGTAPRGGRWNFDQDNRRAFGRQGPGWVPAPEAFPPDPTTQSVLALVQREFADHPGELQAFDWPVTPDQARGALVDFIEYRLPSFGRYQDATWPGAVWLYHSRLSAAMNLGLLDPREVIQAAVAALDRGQAPLSAVEGFVRQILGWREYVRGIYWREMPQYAQNNVLAAQQPLPDFYWTADTEMACLRDVLQRTLATGYAHHIERLMVTGLFALLLGVDPQAVHRWYLAIYVDAVEWVELPNVLGMSQYADGGVLGSKPYAASGHYLQRMGGHCHSCPYDPARATGPEACPFTTLYWDFLQRHQTRFAQHPRTALQWRNLDRKSATELADIRQQAEAIRDRFL